MSWFGLVQKSPVRSGLHAQLPVWLNLCASAKYASLLRRASSARLRSSMSVVTPYHLTMFPSSSRSGTPRSNCQRYCPSDRRETPSPPLVAPLSTPPLPLPPLPPHPPASYYTFPPHP